MQTRTIELSSKEGDVYEIALYDAENRVPDRPLLLVLDAPYLFGTVVETVFIQAVADEIEPPIVAGLAVKGSLTDHATQRVRDYTPAFASKDAVRQSIVWPMIDALRRNTGRDLGDLLGGAQAFREFICERALPAIHAECRYAPDEIGLLGHSASGVFGHHFLLADENPFSRMILGSVGVGWYGEPDINLEKHLLRHKATTSPIQIFQGVGAEELYHPAFGPTLEAGLGALKKLADTFPDKLQLTQKVFDGETHASVMAPLVAAGVRSHYGAGRSFMDAL